MNTKTYTTDLYEGESFSSLMELEERITADLDCQSITIDDINFAEFYILEHVYLNFEINHSVTVTEIPK